MSIKEILEELKNLGSEKLRSINSKNGIGDKQFGVKMGDIRKIAKKIKSNHELGLALWESEYFEAQMLAILIIKPKELSSEKLESMISSIKYSRVSDWFNSYILKVQLENENLRQNWINDKNPMLARSAWYLTSLLVKKNPELLDIPALLDRIENEMQEISSEVQWTMNFTLAEIGINHPKYQQRAIEIGESLGVYKDFPTSKACTSPYAPIWIREMVSRQK